MLGIEESLELAWWRYMFFHAQQSREDKYKNMLQRKLRGSLMERRETLKAWEDFLWAAPG